MSNPTLLHSNSNPPHSSQITTTTSLFERKIEFHLARKPFSGDVNCDKKFQLETLNPSLVMSRSGLNGGNSVKSGRELIEESQLGRKCFDPELSFGITLKRIGAGLENLGNTCFLNSVLQCLTYTEPLVAYLQSGRHQSSCQIAGFCALCAIQKHVSRALTATGRSLAPKDLVSNLRCISRTFRNARQEDAHEYMVQLLESMHKCCLPRGVPSESPSAYEKSLVHKIFGGRLQSQVRCMQCSYCSNKYDPFLDLSLEIARSDSLQKALGHFTAKEQLDDGARQYQCQQCKQKVRAVKQLTIHEAPYVLTIHLKRFSAHDPSHKIDKKVSFSPKLDLKPFVSGSHEGSLMYTLYGVLVHAGWSTRSGHYYCFVRTSTGMWYSLDDNRVIQVNERTVLDQKAYMLFYVRDRKIPAQKNASNFTLNGRMSSHENTLLLTLNKGLKDAGQKQSFEKHVGGENSDGAKKETIREEIHGSSSTATTNCAALKTATSNINASTLKTEIANCKKVAKSPPPTQSCTNSEGSLGNGTIASNTENTFKKDALISTNTLISGSLVRDSENQNEIAVEKTSQIVADACPLGESIISLVDLVSNAKSTPTAEIQLNLPISFKENGKTEVQGGSNLLKPRKGLLKPLVVSMRLSTNVMCGSSGRFIKKKHRKNRQSIIKNPNASQNILETTVSTSDSVSVASTPRHRKSDPVKKELNSRNAPTIGKCNSTAISSDSMPVASGILKCGSNDRFRGDDNKICVNYKVEKVSAVRTGLKRGLEEPIVARWDGTLASTDELVTLTCESSRIGFVPDEWDEEYDRGKRKKVKSAKDVYDGTNPFQEIATSKATARMSKKSQSSSANRPYKIHNSRVP